MPRPRRPSRGRDGVESGRDKPCLCCSQDLLASLALLPIEVEPSPPLSTQDLTLCPALTGRQAQDGRGRAGHAPGGQSRVTFPTPIRHCRPRHKDPEKRWHHDHSAWPLFAQAALGGLRANRGLGRTLALTAKLGAGATPRSAGSARDICPAITPALRNPFGPSLSVPRPRPPAAPHSVLRHLL